MAYLIHRFAFGLFDPTGFCSLFLAVNPEMEIQIQIIQLVPIFRFQTLLSGKIELELLP